MAARDTQRLEVCGVLLPYPAVASTFVHSMRWVDGHQSQIMLAYSRFDDQTRETVHAEYLRFIQSYRDGAGYCIPGEFVAAAGVRPH
jgi:hypothetical protein